MARCWVLVLLLPLAGCWGQGSVTTYLDKKSFEFTGATLFSEPGQITMKEIHFDSGNLLGREVIIEGNVVTTGKFFTHLVMVDDSGRMLVVLTKIENAEELLSQGKPEKLKVLGTIERGKKGLPYVLAKSLRSIKEKSVQ